MLDTRKHTIYSRDPFAVDPLPTAHYHPSPERRLTKTQRNISLSPKRSQDGREQQQGDRLSHMDEIFLKGTNSYQSKTTDHPETEDVHLDESWPSSERPSSLNLTGFDDDCPLDFGRYQATLDKFTGMKQTVKFQEPEVASSRHSRPTAKSTHTDMTKKQGMTGNSKLPVMSSGVRAGKVKNTKKPTVTETQGGEDGHVDGSVLSRYVDRFRNSAPLSREEREQQRDSSSKDFWWLSSQGQSPGSDCSTPRDGPEVPRGSDVRNLSLKEGHRGTTKGVTPLTTVNLDKYKHLQNLEQNGRRGMQMDSPGDKRTVELQERADRLLERSSSTVLSTDPAVSTEGLGSNMSDMSSLEEYPFRPKFANYIAPDMKPAYQPAPVPRPGVTPRPEDDPLHQWRLRRRMEQAQDTAPKHLHSFGFMDKTEQQKKIEDKLDDFKRKLSGKETTTPVTHTSSHYQFTPATQTPIEPAITTDTVTDTQHHRTTTEPHIASPILHRRRPQADPQSEVDPHLHLMCDLLPCPHQDQYQSHLVGTDKQSKGSNSNGIVDDNCKESKTKGDNYNVKMSASEVSRYKQYLEAEKPDVDKPKCDTSSDTEDRRINKVKTKDTNSAGLRINTTTKNAADTKSDNKHTHRQDKKVTYSDNLEKASKVGQDRIKGQTSRSDIIEAVHDESSESDGESQTEYSRYTGDNSNRSTDKKEKIPRPKHSSSPKVERKGVAMAIGQVVKDHMFAMSTSTVLSSVESLPPTASVDKLPRKQHKHIRLPPKQHDSTGDECHSEGELEDDHLLQMLRKQRAVYEQQLQDIDEMLITLEKR